MTDDIKSWITLLDAPVVAIVDSDGNGSGAKIDHYVLVTGYDDRKEKIWINNSGANLGKSGGGGGWTCVRPPLFRARAEFPKIMSHRPTSLGMMRI